MANETTPDPRNTASKRSTEKKTTGGTARKSATKKATQAKSTARSGTKSKTAKTGTKKATTRSGGKGTNTSKTKPATGSGGKARTAASATSTRSRSQSDTTTAAADIAGTSKDAAEEGAGLSKRTEDLLWRLIAMIAFGFVGVFALYLLFIIAAVQYLVTVLRGRPHDEVQRGLGWLHGYLRQILSYLCFETEQMPWPLGELPETMTPRGKDKP